MSAPVGVARPSIDGLTRSLGAAAPTRDGHLDGGDTVSTSIVGTVK